MPLPFAPLLGWLIGLGLAWAARSDGGLPQSPPAQGDDARPNVPRVVVLAAAFAALVYAPVVGYFAAFHGDWSYLYAVRWHAIPSALDLVVVVVASASIPVAAAIARPIARAGRRGALLRLAAGPAALSVALAAVAARRLATSATYAQFHGGYGAEALTSSTLGRSVLLAALVLVAGVAWTARATR